MNALLEQFLVEARELMDTAVPALLQMERGEGGTAVVNTVFRAVHTLKGTSGLFDFAPLTSMVHAGEDLLDALRAGFAVTVDTSAARGVEVAPGDSERALAEVRAAGGVTT